MTFTATPSMLTIFADGFETGDYSNWTKGATGPAPGSVKAVVPNAAFAGAYGAQLSDGVGGFALNGSSVSKTFLAPASRVVSAQTRIQVNTLSGTGTVRLFQLRDSFSNLTPVKVRYANGVAQLLLVQLNGTQVIANFATNLTTGSWHLVELMYDWSGAQAVGQIWVDGVLQARIVDASTGPAIIPNTVFLIVYEDVATAAVDAYYDDVLVADRYIGMLPTQTPTVTPVGTPPSTSTPNVTATPTVVPTSTPTAIPTNTPTLTPTPTQSASPTNTATPCSPVCTATSTPTITATSTQTTTPTPVIDYTDVLELYFSAKSQSDFGFERVSQLYGLKRADLDLSTTNLTDNLLRDQVGSYYLLVYIDGAHLANLNATQVQVLKNAIEVGGLNLLTTAFRGTGGSQMQLLTSNEIMGSASVADNSEDYMITTSLPEVTKEFTGKTITYAGPQLDYALQLQLGAAHTQVLVNSTDNNHQVYPIFARFKNAGGSIFVVSNYADMFLEWNVLMENYANSSVDRALIQQWFSQITPLMMVVRYAGGNEAWHNNHDYANFTIDDERLQSSQPYNFNWAGILQESIAHNFHLTNAMIPLLTSVSEQSVINLFLNNPDRLSLVQHGNNHDGYEFYKYTTSPGDPYPARPYADQEANIVQGMQRLQAFSQTTGIPVGQTMIFPFNISPPDTLTLLKKYNFQATINSLDYPLTTTRVRNWDSYMNPAEMSYNDFAVIKRYSPLTSPYPFDLFLDHPTFLYAHKDFFDSLGITGLDPIADEINASYGNVEWKSIDYIMKHMYLERLNDDGTWDAKFYGNDLIVSNETAGDLVYHIKRDEIANVPIFAVSLDNGAVSYSVGNGQFQVDALIPAHTSREVKIVYGTGP